MLVFIWYEVKNKTQANEAVEPVHCSGTQTQPAHCTVNEVRMWEWIFGKWGSQPALKGSHRSKVDPSSQWPSKVATAPPGVHLTKQHVIMFICCIYLPHLKGQSLKILSDIKLVWGKKKVRWPLISGVPQRTVLEPILFNLTLGNILMNKAWNTFSLLCRQYPAISVKQTERKWPNNQLNWSPALETEVARAPFSWKGTLQKKGNFLSFKDGKYGKCKPLLSGHPNSSLSALQLIQKHSCASANSNWEQS